jgi:hypothetical protein
MKRIDLVKDKKDDTWVSKSGGKPVPGTRAKRKEDSLQKSVKKAKADPDNTTLKIHKENGEFQSERTYPRSADPRKSKG